MQSIVKLKRELKNLNDFYKTTLFSYQSASRTKDLEVKIKKRLNNISSRNQTESILRELILVRVISALETFLTDLIREVFVATKIPFMDKDVRVEFSQQELIAKNTPTAIYSQIINRETRKLTNGGFNEFIKYFKKRFAIDISSIQPGYKILNEYHDRRHILVHRLGKTDEIYRKKHSVQTKSLSVTEAYLKLLLKNIETFSETLEIK